MCPSSKSTNEWYAQSWQHVSPWELFNTRLKLSRFFQGQLRYWGSLLSPEFSLKVLICIDPRHPIVNCGTRIICCSSVVVASAIFLESGILQTFNDTIVQHHWLKSTVPRIWSWYFSGHQGFKFISAKKLPWTTLSGPNQKASNNETLWKHHQTPTIYHTMIISNSLRIHIGWRSVDVSKGSNRFSKACLLHWPCPKRESKLLAFSRKYTSFVSLCINVHRFRVVLELKCNALRELYMVLQRFIAQLLCRDFVHE